MCELKGLYEAIHASKKGIFEKFFLLIQLEGEIVVQRKLKVKYKKNEFKKKETKKTKDQAKTERKTEANAKRDEQKQKVMKQGCKKHLMKEKRMFFMREILFF